MAEFFDDDDDEYVYPIPVEHFKYVEPTPSELFEYVDPTPKQLTIEIDGENQNVSFEKRLGEERLMRGFSWTRYSCRREDNGKQCKKNKYAIKLFDFNDETDFDRERKIRNRIQDSICKKYALHLIGTHEDANYYYIITDYDNDYVELHDYIVSQNPETPETLETEQNFQKRILRNIHTAILELHSIYIAYLDIKPKNILVNPNTGDIKIINFGFSCNSVNLEEIEEIDENAVECLRREYFGTRMYMDCRLFYKMNILAEKQRFLLEIYRDLENFTITIDDYKKADLWAFGIICIIFDSNLNHKEPHVFITKDIPLFAVEENIDPRSIRPFDLFMSSMYNYFFIFCLEDYAEYLKEYSARIPEKGHKNWQNLFKKYTEDEWNKHKRTFNLIMHSNKIVKDIHRYFDNYNTPNPFIIPEYFIDSDGFSKHYDHDQYHHGGKLIKYARRNKKRKNKTKKHIKRHKPKRSKRKQ
jgi:serine/threonine protein kinase